MKHNYSMEEALAQCDAPEDDDERRYQAEADRVAELIAPMLKAKGEKRTKPRRYFAIDEPLLQRIYPEAHWLVDGLVTRGGIALIGGSPKTGKTWVLQEIIRALATGMPVFGRFAVQRPMCGVYFTPEDFGGPVQKHMLALGASASWTDAHRRRFDDNLDVQAAGEGPSLDLLDDQAVIEIIASARMFGERDRNDVYVPGSIDFVALDPLRNLHSGKENESDSMGPVMDRLKIIGQLLGATVLVVHHAGHNDELRGSTAIYGSTDSLIKVKRIDGNGTTIFHNAVTNVVKAAASAPPFKLSLRVTDGADGRATAAAWSIGDPDAVAAAPGRDGKPAEVIPIGDPLVDTIVQKLLSMPDKRMAIGALEKTVPGANARKRAAIARLKAEGLIVEVFAGRRSAGAQLTPAGVEFARMPAPAAPAQPPAAPSGALAGLLAQRAERVGSAPPGASNGS